MHVVYVAVGEAQMSTIPKLFDREQLKRLKNECGGLQTLLKLNGSIFHVYGGVARLRAPKTMRFNPEAKGFKRRPCWLYQHHPDGCPRVADECSFAHGADDLLS
eukprot:m.107468 g.107468  ORF g.107468 m.107468 type:complete len:104 (-) comp15314_c0_seq12:118-429(-)